MKDSPDKSINKNTDEKSKDPLLTEENFEPLLDLGIDYLLIYLKGLKHNVITTNLFSVMYMGITICGLIKQYYNSEKNKRFTMTQKIPCSTQVTVH